MQPLFFAFDGVDGAGKSTQIDLFCARLRQMGREVTACRDPGDTPLGERLRSVLLDRDEAPRGMRAEMLMYMAARAQLVEQLIRPALEAGRTVVSDRFLLSNVAYQGHAGGLPPEEIWRIGELATAGLRPDLTFVLDLGPEAAAARRTGEPDRIESRGVEFFERVRQGLLREAAADPQRICVIDAGQHVAAVHDDVLRAAAPLLDNRRLLDNRSEES